MFRSLAALLFRPAEADPAAPSPTILVIGGAEGAHGTAVLASVEALDFVSGTKRFAPSLAVPRRGAVASVVGGDAFVFGGWDGKMNLASGEVLRGGASQWAPIASAPSRRSCACATVIGLDVYVLGGYDGMSALPTAEAYNSGTDTWTTLPDMRIPRKNAVAVTIDGEVAVVGGWDERSTLDTIEVFNPRTKEWRILDMRLNRPRECASAVKTGQASIILMGGYNDREVIMKSTEIVDFTACTSSPGPDLPSGREVGLMDALEPSLITIHCFEVHCRRRVQRKGCAHGRVEWPRGAELGASTR